MLAPIADVVAAPETPLQWLNRLLERNDFDTQEILKSNRLSMRGHPLTGAGRLAALKGLKEERTLLLEQRAKLTGEPVPQEGSSPENPPADAGGSPGDGPKEPVRA